MEQSGQSTPRVSVVIPTFGRPAMVVRAIRSVLQQTMADLEVVVVIDGIDPATIVAIEELDDPRVRILSHDHRMGAGKTRDGGAEASRGEWIAFLDDDDEWLPGKLEGQLAIATPRSIVICRTRVVAENGDYVRPGGTYDNRIPFDEWLFGRTTWLADSDGFLQTSSLLIPRILFERLKFADAKHEEWEFVLRATKILGCELLIAPGVDVIYYAGSTPGSLSKSYTWPTSLDWIDGLGDLVTRRGYSGFCLVNIARMAALAQDYSAIPKLLSAAIRNGSPTPKQLFAFALIWLFPTSIRLKLRKAISTQRA